MICGHGHEKNLNIPSPKTAREVKCPIPGPKQSIKSLPYAMISIDWIPRDFRLSTKPEFLVARRNFSRIGDRTGRNFKPLNIVSNQISWMDNSSRCWWNVRILMSDHNVKLAGYIQSLIGQYQMTDWRYFQPWSRRRTKKIPKFSWKSLVTYYNETDGRMASQHTKNPQISYLRYSTSY